MTRVVRLIPSRKIRDGVELARDVVAGPPGTAPLLRRGAKLSERYATLLPKAGVGSVWIEDELGEAIDVAEPLTPETRAKVHRATGAALSAAGGALRAGSGMPPAVVESLADVAIAMVDDLLNCPDAALALDDLSAFDDYTHRHSVQVTLLGLLIARRAWTKDGWTDFRGKRRHDRLESRLRKLGLGLLVHDVGKLAVPPEILNKPGRLTDDEMAVMKTHPVAGAELLRPADLSPLALSVVRDHHERIDGSGYPEGLVGAQVQEFARIAAVADVYDAITSERVYKPAAPPHVGVRIIREGSGAQFCEDVVRHFRAIVLPYPLGHEIELPDGRLGVVAACDPDDPDHPTVRVLGAAGVEELTLEEAVPAGTDREPAVVQAHGQ
jgi:HD-GYP domain-containing protein (c-di-GMP phosphodiesterase class II)